MIYPLIVLAIVVFYLIYFYNYKKSRKVDAFPANWHDLLMKHVIFYKNLSEEEQKRFQNRIMMFLSEVYIDGVGVEVDDLDKVLVASSAVIPVFQFPEWHYTNLSTVLLYPDTFNEDLDFGNQDKNRRILGMVGDGQFKNHMILSKKALERGFLVHNDKHNTGIHEFVHLIDKSDGVTNGIPEHLLTKPYIIPWLKLIHKEMEAINDDDSDIRNYGGTNEAEFLAVAAEYFFEQPKLMERKHPELYKMLKMCFHTK